MELYIPVERPQRNPVNGRFLKGHVPFNKGRKWSDYIDTEKAVRMLKGLEGGRKGNPSMPGWNARPIVAVKDGRFMGWFRSSYDAERKTGIQGRNIRLCCNGKRRHAGGLRWFFEDDDGWPELIGK